MAASPEPSPNGAPERGERRKRPGVYDLQGKRRELREREGRGGSRPSIDYREAERRRRRSEQDSVIEGSLWMVGLSLALFFLPLINGFIAGLVGGYKVGTVKRGLAAAVLPAVVVAVGLWVLLSVFGLPLMGFIAGVAVSGWIALSDIGLFVGAAIGGAFGGMRNR